MTNESISLPAERVAPIAAAVASQRKSIAGVVFFGVVIVAIAMMSVVTRSTGTRSDPESVGRAIGTALWPGLLGWFGLRQLRRARQASAAQRATQDASFTWLLNERLVVAVDGHGVARPELAFKVSREQRQILIAVPRAQVVQPGEHAP